jgi:hypothetical protein
MLSAGALGSAAIADDSQERRRGLLFEASYERPFSIGYVLPRSGLSPPYQHGGDVSFRLRQGEGATAVEGHMPGQLYDCGSDAVHFCIDGGYFSFAAPRPDASKDWSVRVRDHEFQLMSVRRIRFRGSDIEVMRIKGIDWRFKAKAWYFIFNYEVGLIAFADITAANVRPNESRVPDALAGAAVLASEHGLGGRRYCDHWRCGPAPPPSR